jgi:hypothetical protein
MTSIFVQAKCHKCPSSAEYVAYSKPTRTQVSRGFPHVPISVNCCIYFYVLGLSSVSTQRVSAAQKAVAGDRAVMAFKTNLTGYRLSMQCIF